MNQKLVVHSYPSCACREGSSGGWIKDLLTGTQPHPFAFPSFPCLWLWQAFGSVGKNLHWDCARLCQGHQWCAPHLWELILNQRAGRDAYKRLKAGELRWWTAGTGTVPARRPSWYQQLHDNTETSFADKVSYMDLYCGGKDSSVTPKGFCLGLWITLHQRMLGLLV